MLLPLDGGGWERVKRLSTWKFTQYNKIISPPPQTPPTRGGDIFKELLNSKTLGFLPHQKKRWHVIRLH
jgi:hypothetical protein